MPGGEVKPGLSRYASFLPVAAGEMVSLSEGGTPLCRTERLAAALGLDELFIKDESRNPTWSYKDRLSSIAVSYALRSGARVVATSSSGNAGASLAAYAAKAGLPCIVITFHDAAGPLLDQVRKYGAMVLPLEDKNQRWPLLERGVREFGWFATSPFAGPVVGSHPVGIEGYKTIAYETFEQLGGDVPDWFVLPVAYGDALAGIWRGFKDLKQLGLCSTLPKMVAAEIYGSIEQTLAANVDNLVNVVPDFSTSSISIGTTQSSYQALKAIRESDGLAVSVDDREILDWQEALAAHEGLLGELSAVVPVAAISRLRNQGIIRADDRIVGLMTASGLKDLDHSIDPEARYPNAPAGFGNALRYLSEHYRFDAADKQIAQ